MGLSSGGVTEAWFRGWTQAQVDGHNNGWGSRTPHPDHAHGAQERERLKDLEGPEYHELEVEGFGTDRMVDLYAASLDLAAERGELQPFSREPVSAGTLAVEQSAELVSGVLPTQPEVMGGDDSTAAQFIVAATVAQ